MKLVLVLAFATLLCRIESARILGVFPMPAKSHYILGRALMRGLAERGHDVTVISPFGEAKPPKNGKYRDILITSLLPPSDKNSGHNLFDMESMSPLLYPIFMNFLGNNVTEETFKSDNVQKLLKSGEKFDAVIVEQFVNDAHKVFSYHFKAPLILFVTFGSNAWINPLVCNPAPPSYVPELMINFEATNFIDRLKNIILNIYGELNKHLLFFPAQNKILKEYFPDAPDIKDLIYNASLVLLNSHLSTNQAVPRVPSMVDIGGFHVEPPKKLPKDLQDFLDQATEGVIYFSMGSNLRSANLPPEKRDILLKTFSKLKQKVLWKWEEDSLPGQPSNVKLGKWLPQQDILAHPNVKIFITHGGLLSLIESVYHAVPVLAIPVFGDQQINAAEIAWNHMGLSLPYSSLSEEALIGGLNELLINPLYRENMKRRSEIMHDRQASPLDEAEYWIKYVIRHHGAPHLRVAGLKLAWYQYLGLDVAVFILSIILFIFILLVVLTRKICAKLCKSKLQTKVKKS